MPRNPASPALRNTSRSTMPARSHSSTWGTSSLSTNCRKLARNSSCSSSKIVRRTRRAYVGEVRIGVVSDVHGNVPALRAALDAFTGRIDELWCAGDIVHEYRFSTETVELLRDSGAVAIQGNHDMVLLSPAGAGARERPGVSAGAVEWLASLPYEHEVVLGGTRVRMVHGSPWEPFGDYLRAHNPK